MQRRPLVPRVWTTRPAVLWPVVQSRLQVQYKTRSGARWKGRIGGDDSPVRNGLLQHVGGRDVSGSHAASAAQKRKAAPATGSSLANCSNV